MAPKRSTPAAILRPRTIGDDEIPKQIVVLDELPMLPIGKVDKKNLKASNGPGQ